MNSGTRDRLAAAFPYAAFAALCAITWKRWIFPFQDHGRELHLPARLLSGELLYRDVASPFGPLPPYLDALALRLFGRTLDVLIAVRLLAALAGIEALRRLLARIAVDRATAGAIAAFVAMACFACYGSAWAFPYSVAALWGTVGTWWAIELALGAASLPGALLAGAVAGLAAGTKLEIAPAALAGLLLALAGRRPARHVAAAVGVAAFLAALAWGGPVLLLGREILERQGYLIALRDPEPWRRMQRMVVFAGMSPRAFLLGGYALALASSMFFLGSAALLLVASKGRRWAAPSAFFVGLASAAVQKDEELHLLLPLAALLGIGFLWRRLRGAADERAVALAAVGAAMLFALWRQPFLLRIGVYSAFAAPLALACALAWASTRLPAAAMGAFVLGLTLAQGIDRYRDRRAIPMTWVTLPHVSVYLPSETAPVVTGAVREIEKTRPDAWVAAFPEPGLLLFATGRRNPFGDEQFFPGNQAPSAEDEMIRRLDERPLSIALQTNQTLTAFGAGEYRRGVLDRFFRAFDTRMQPARGVGDPRLSIRHLGTATAAVVYVPRGER